MSFIELFILAVGLSMDAFAVSVCKGLAVQRVTLRECSLAGVRIGSVFGTIYKSKAEFCGGVILVLIGLKILLEHMGVFG